MPGLGRDPQRDIGRPERTVYEITGPGVATLRTWMAEMLPSPAREFPEFPLALALMPAGKTETEDDAPVSEKISG